MNAPALRTTVRRRRQPRGFSLIELGIVIAVIAVLASVVIFGRGFIASGRITKAVEGMNSIRKSASTVAGLQGGALTTSIASELPRLTARQLLPPLNAVGEWEVSGTGNDSIKVQNLQYGQVLAVGTTAPVNSVAIRIWAPTPTMTQDIWNSVSLDNNLIKSGPVIGTAPACATPATGPTNAGQFIWICFYL